MKKLSFFAGVSAIALAATTLLPAIGAYAQTATYLTSDEITLTRTVSGVTNPVTNTFTYTMTADSNNPGTVTGMPSPIQIVFNNTAPNGSNVATILGFSDGRIPVQQAFGGAQYYGDDECNAMIDAVYVEEDKDEQIKKMNDLCTYLIDKGVMVGLCSVPKCFPCRPELEGMRFTTTAYMNVSEVHPAQ